MRNPFGPKHDPIKNYFPLPNEIYSLRLSSTSIAIYGYLLYREDRKTYQCLASYRMIAEAIGKSVTTVRKYVCELEERGLITTERTSIMTKDGRKWNGCLRYHILPIRAAVDLFNECQLRAVELDGARHRADQRQKAFTQSTARSRSQTAPRDPL